MERRGTIYCQLTTSYSPSRYLSWDPTFRVALIVDVFVHLTTCSLTFWLSFGVFVWSVISSCVWFTYSSSEHTVILCCHYSKQRDRGYNTGFIALHRLLTITVTVLSHYVSWFRLYIVDFSFAFRCRCVDNGDILRSDELWTLFIICWYTLAFGLF